MQWQTFTSKIFLSHLIFLIIFLLLHFLYLQMSSLVIRSFHAVSLSSHKFTGGDGTTPEAKSCISLALNVGMSSPARALGESTLSMSYIMWNNPDNLYLCALVSLRQYRGFSGGVEGAGSGKSGTRPERNSVSRDHQSGCPPPALVHVSSAMCFYTVEHRGVLTQDPHLFSRIVFLFFLSVTVVL